MLHLCEIRRLGTRGEHNHRDGRGSRIGIRLVSHIGILRPITHHLGITSEIR